MREHALLRRPAHDQPLALDAALERAEPTFCGSGGEVWPDNPHERSAGERVPVGKLLELRRVQDAGAPEGDVDDGAGGLRVEPGEAGEVFGQEMSGRPGRRRYQWAERQRVREQGQSVRFHLHEGVAYDRLS